MGKPLRILFVDDSPDDVELLLYELRRGGYDPTFERVETASAMKTMLERQSWDIVLSDHSMPRFSAIGALKQLKLSGLDLPFIIVSGAIGEDLAVASMKAGVHDFIMKNNLARLVPVIDRELIDAAERQKCKLAEETLNKYHESLERLVAERTAALMETNEALRMEIEKHARMEEQIRYIAFYDTLTSLPNRTLFNDRLALALAHAHRTGETLAVLFLDLDRFKAVNDTLGHSVGDQLLRIVADRLKSCIREEDTVARFAGDEFTILLLGVIQAEHIISIVRKILYAIRQPLMIGGYELYITSSIGIALYPGDGEDAEALLKNADTAMYDAKEQGRNNYQFYTSSMHIRSFEKMVLESNLRRALDREEFVVYYQPLVSISTGQIVGLEALVRWRHPDRGLISPEEFLVLSENTRLIVYIDELVLYTVCVQCKSWQDAGFQPLCVAVNISAHTFQQPNLVEMVMSVLQKTGLDPHFLGLEITEGIAMQDIETTINKLNRLNALGIQIAIDDFGTGFSSLYYLKKFPIHKLKISRHFVSGIETDLHDQLIVASVIALAQSLKFKVVAEGIETEEQLNFLKQQNCDEMQGYLFCKPLPAEEFRKMAVRDIILQGSR
ncbi:MAG: EAL domain-containing protein [Candidatus Brocadia sp.]|nr:EAL domain-containing protein [Candidatus Brocadia sp.]